MRLRIAGKIAIVYKRVTKEVLTRGKVYGIIIELSQETEESSGDVP